MASSSVSALPLKTSGVTFHSVGDRESLFEVRRGVAVDHARDFARVAFIAIQDELNEAVAGDPIEGDRAYLLVLAIESAIAADAAAWEGAGFKVD